MNKLSTVDLSDRQIKNRLMSWYSVATEDQIGRGFEWYKEAQAFTQDIAKRFRISPYVVACVVSCLSPSVKWSRNKLDAFNIIEAHTSGKDPHAVTVCTYGQNKTKAIKILNEQAQLLSVSPKTHSFAMNIAKLSRDHVTVDRWHMRACTIAHNAKRCAVVEAPTAKQYRRVERITAELAQQIGIAGFEIQAIIWLSVREGWSV